MTKKEMYHRMTYTWIALILLSALNGLVLHLNVFWTILLFFAFGMLFSRAGYYLFPFMYKDIDKDDEA